MPISCYLATANTIAQILGFLGAFVFFIYKVITGYFMVNVGISARGERSNATDTTDHLFVAVTIKKGSHASLMLHDARARFGWDGGSKEVELIGIHRLSFKTVQDGITRKCVTFDKLSKSAPLLRFTTDEEATFSGMTEVPCNKPCSIEVVILGIRHSIICRTKKVGQWRTSIIVFPNKKENMQNEAF